jgi:hypothetical protein
MYLPLPLPPLLQGLIMLEAGTNRVVILANRVSASSPLHPNEPLMYTNDLDIGPDGTIYFTDSVDVNPHRNAQHNNNVSHIVSILGKPGYYDTVKGWALGMLQVRHVLFVSCQVNWAAMIARFCTAVGACGRPRSSSQAQGGRVLIV